MREGQKWYREMLLDPRWQKKRTEILGRDGFACVLCKEDTLTLHIDHLHYVTGKKPWEYDNASLQTLCEKCHYDKSAKKMVKKDGAYRPLRLRPSPVKRREDQCSTTKA